MNIQSKVSTSNNLPVLKTEAVYFRDFMLEEKVFACNFPNPICETLIANGRPMVAYKVPINTQVHFPEQSADEQSKSCDLEEILRRSPKSEEQLLEYLIPKIKPLIGENQVALIPNSESIFVENKNMLLCKFLHRLIDGGEKSDTYMLCGVELSGHVNVKLSLFDVLQGQSASGSLESLQMPS